MRAAIIPPEKLPLFDRALTPELPWIRVGPVPIYAGTHMGSFAVNEAILDSCPEWRAVADKARALCAEHGVQILEVNPEDLKNPDESLAP